MAVKVEVISGPDDNQLRNVRGIVDRGLGPKGFGFIRCTDGKGLEPAGGQVANTELLYFFPSCHLIVDDESNRRGNTARTGDEVMFDCSWNHKYNPPKPIASNVRLLPSSSSSVTNCGSFRTKSIQRSASVGCNPNSPPLNGNNRDRWSVQKQQEENSDARLSMGKASLRTLVKSLVRSGKTQYLQIRNCLQKPEYCGRSLTREERQIVSELLQELVPQSSDEESSSPSAKWEVTNRRSGIRRQASSRNNKGSNRSASSLSPETQKTRPPLPRTLSRNASVGRISLSDMCRDPSLHSRLSAANSRGARVV